MKMETTAVYLADTAYEMFRRASTEAAGTAVDGGALVARLWLGVYAIECDAVGGAAADGVGCDVPECVAGCVVVGGKVCVAGGVTVRLRVPVAGVDALAVLGPGDAVSRSVVDGVGVLHASSRMWRDVLVVTPMWKLLGRKKHAVMLLSLHGPSNMSA
jgi:hypothetical protein